MIMKKAPKDMNAVEFVDYLINGGVLTSIPDDDSFIKLAIIKDALNKPAPNPFTPDQLAWMREEQKSGFEYAWCDKKGYVWCSAALPSTGIIETGGWECAGCHGVGMGSFLRRMLSSDDSEPLRFADYAPLE